MIQIYIEGVKVEGPPREVAKLLAEMQVLRNMHLAELEEREKTVSAKPVRTKSDILRSKLAEDPNHNPYGGVVPSKETLVEREEQRLYSAERDTGIDYE